VQRLGTRGQEKPCVEQGGFAPLALPHAARKVSGFGLANDLQCHLCRVSGFAFGFPNFDRHTLSIKGTKLSLFTLDGRMHFELTLPEEQLLLFKVAKLREISLTRRLDGLYELAFWLEAAQTQTVHISHTDALEGQGLQQTQGVPAEILAARSLIPDYLSIEVAA